MLTKRKICSVQSFLTRKTLYATVAVTLAVFFFVYVNLRCIAKNQKKISKMSTLPPPLKKILRTPMLAAKTPWDILVRASSSSLLMLSSAELLLSWCGLTNRNTSRLRKLKLSTNKTVSVVFHLNNKEAKRELESQL